MPVEWTGHEALGVGQCHAEGQLPPLGPQPHPTIPSQSGLDQGRSGHQLYVEARRKVSTSASAQTAEPRLERVQSQDRMSSSPSLPQ